MNNFINFSTPLYFYNKTNTLDNVQGEVTIDIINVQFILSQGDILYVNKAYPNDNNHIKNNIVLHTFHNISNYEMVLKYELPLYKPAIKENEIVLECGSRDDVDRVYNKLNEILCGNPYRHSIPFILKPSIDRIKYIIYSCMNEEEKNEIKGLTESENSIYENIFISNEETVKKSLPCNSDKLTIKLYKSMGFVYKCESMTKVEK